MNNIVYWITEDVIDGIPHSDRWTNDLYFTRPGCFEDALDSLLRTFSVDNHNRYAIVTNLGVECRAILNKRFISNNVIHFEPGSFNADKIKSQINWILSDYGKERFDDEKVFFWSDPHFFHGNIIKYCNRPWNSGTDSAGNTIVTESDIEKMNEEIIANFNSVVTEDSTTWCLGDFCLGKNQNENIPDIVSRLNGKINLILGNHDNHSVEFYYDAGFNRVYDSKIIINDYLILSHSPLEFLNKNCPFASIYGHVHDSANYPTFTSNSCCACLERHGYKPISLKQVMSGMEHAGRS